MTTHIRNQLNLQNPKWIDQNVRYFEWIEKYFQYETVGLKHIPKNRGCLVVMNHGIVPFHAFLMAKALIQKRKIYPRGLGAGTLFSIPGLRDFLLKSGAVNANPKNAKVMLEKKQCVMLAPGGIYEGLVCHPGMTRIPWERRKGFVKMSIEAGVPIIPTYCHGINEVYFNSKFLLRWRIKMLERTRFSFPIFYGLGLLPFRHKLIHFVGKPIEPKRKRGETQTQQIDRIHHEVIDSIRKLMD